MTRIDKSERLDETTRLTKVKEMEDLHSNGSDSLIRNEPDNALAYYKQALEMAKELNHSKVGNYSYDIGVLLFEIGRYEDAAHYVAQGADAAKRTYEEATKLGQERASSHAIYMRAKLLQGVSLYTSGKRNKSQSLYWDAIAAFDEIINSASGIDKARALKNKGNVLSLLGKYQEAIGLYDQAIQIYPNYPAAFTNNGNAFYGLGNYEKAEICYKDALRMIQSGTLSIGNPQEVKVTTYLHLALSKYNNGDTVGALQILDSNLDDKELDDKELDDKHLSAGLKARKYNITGLCHLRQKVFDKAERDFDNAIQNNSNFVDAHYHLAVLYASQKNRDKARICLNNCLKINPNFSPAQDALRKLERFKKADWIGYWGFDDRYKRVIGGSLIILALAEIIAIFYLIFAGISVTSNGLYALYAGLGVTVLLLILPTLKNFEIFKFMKFEINLTEEEIAIDLEVSRPHSSTFT